MTNRVAVRVGCVALVLVLALSVHLGAQSSIVTGTITYRDGKPAVNVFVSIGGRYRYTDVRGRYKIDGVPQGKQRMIVKLGTRVLWEGEVAISGQSTIVDRKLP